MEHNGGCTAIVVAGGRGIRLNAELPKQFLLLGGKPVLARTLDAFALCPQVGEVILVIGEGQEEYCHRHILSYGYPKVKRVVTGGAQRQFSVYNGLREVDPGAELVLVHDGARPFISLRDLERVIMAARETGAAILGVRVIDTVKKADDDAVITDTLDRNVLWAVQTPQVFWHTILKQAYEKALGEDILATDDASLVERLGHKVRLVEGSFNLKITTAEDLAMGTALIAGGFFSSLSEPRLRHDAGKENVIENH